MKKPKKPRKDSVIKKLQKKADRLWYRACLQRDHSVCQIKIHFPHKCFNDSIMQVHHIFSDGKHHNLSFDMENGISLCRKCHCAVSFGNDAYKEMVRIIAERRGKYIFERLFEQSLVPGPHLCWKDVSWLEEQVRILEGMVRKDGF